ncbi:hypothetical protein [uncultured Pseudoteredinibacter sp.]|uniref:hypothetical protein n=1 Tax=uncultured Pseudoteredinibacter sp. TaxID=1641701 RepID=UPI00261543D0|nr:hypothetical protein [uncultured Pseudoteredinibacter sp.]
MRITTLLIFLTLSLTLNKALATEHFELYPKHSEPAHNPSQAVSDKHFEIADKLIADFNQKPNGLYSKVDDITIWQSYSGQYNRMWMETALTNEDVEKQLKQGIWKAVPIPKVAYKTMHLPRNIPAELMSCFLGQLDGKPTYLFWSKARERAAFVVKLD